MQTWAYGFLTTISCGSMAQPGGGRQRRQYRLRGGEQLQPKKAPTPRRSQACVSAPVHGGELSVRASVSQLPSLHGSAP